MNAKDVMTHDVVSVDKDDRLPAVLEQMKKTGISKFPVTENGSLVGLLVDGDIADELGATKNRNVATSQLRVTSAMRKHCHTVNLQTPLQEILFSMQTHDTGMLPVVHDKSLVGVVTASDLITHVTSHAPVSDFMTSPLHALGPSDRVIHARRLMLDHHIERLPVLDGGRLVGIVGELDVAIGLWKFRESVANHHQANQLKDFHVETIMRRQIITAPPTTTAAEAAKTMRSHDVGSLPIVQGERVQGIVTRSDLLRLLDV